jgi:hypothetical protein
VWSFIDVKFEGINVCTMDRIWKHLHLLRYLSTSDNVLIRKKIIEAATTEQIITICEISCNILEGVFELSHEELEQLVRYKKVYRKLCEKTVNFSEKRAVLLKQSASIKRLLHVFFSHWSAIKQEQQQHGRWSEKTGSDTTDTVQTTSSTPREGGQSPISSSESEDDDGEGGCISNTGQGSEIYE